MIQGRTGRRAATLAILASVVLAGCRDRQPEPAERLVGSWQGTVSVNEKKLEPALPAVDGKVQLKAIVKTLEAVRRRVVFHANGSVEVSESSGVDLDLPHYDDGIWKVVDSDERFLQVEMVTDNPRQDRQENRQLWKIEFTDRDHFRIQTGPAGAEDAIVQQYNRQVLRD